MAENVLHLLLTRPRVAREVAHVVRDLRPRGSHEVLEHVRDERALLRRRAPRAPVRGAGAQSFRPHPSARASRAGSCESLASCSTSQRRSSTSCRNGASTRPDSSCPATTPRPLSPYSILPAATWSSTASTSSGSARYGSSSGASSLSRSSGPTTAARRSDTIQVVEPEVVREEVRDPALEEVELRQRVLADPEQDVHAQARLGHELRQAPRERTVGIVVEEVLLDLVEDQMRVAFRCGDRPSSISSVGSSPHELMIATEESANVRSLCATPARSSELFPTPRRPVQDGQPRGEQVGDDDLALPLASEEEQCVERLVVERRQTLVRPERRFSRSCRQLPSAVAPAP